MNRSILGGILLLGCILLAFPACVQTNTRAYVIPDLELDKTQVKFGILGFTGDRHDYQTILTDAVTLELLGKGYIIVERSRLDPIFKEHEMAQTGMIEGEAQQALMLNNVNYLVLGSMDSRSGRLTHMSVRVVRIKTGQVIAGASWSGRVSFDEVSEVACSLASRLARKMD